MTDIPKIKTVAVIGTGAMGSGIAQLLAKAGFEVLLFDADPAAAAKAVATIGGRLQRQVERGSLAAAAAEEARGRLAVLEQWAGLAAVDLAIEVVPERLDLKKEVFVQMDLHARAGALLLSNTSGLDIGKLAAVTRRPAQVAGMHFFNPPPLMPLVEVVSAAQTAEETLVAVEELAVGLGKTPIRVRNSPGFVVNRILFPMINEAVFALAEGVAAAADIDRAMQLGASYPLGPLALADFVGLDITLDILESFEARLGQAKYKPCPLLREKVACGHLGRKSGQGFFSYP